jgi:hypothetical protein
MDLFPGGPLPMDEHIQALSDATSSSAWPDRWLSIPEIDQELEAAGFWQRPGLSGWSKAERRAWLLRALAAEKEVGRGLPIWACVGRRYKHLDVVERNADDREGLAGWAEEVQEASWQTSQDVGEGQPQAGGTEVVLDPLAPPAEECLRQAEQTAERVLELLPDSDKVGDARNLFDHLRRTGVEPVRRLVAYRAWMLAAMSLIDGLIEDGTLDAGSLDGDAGSAYRLAKRTERFLDSALVPVRTAEE